MHIDFLDCRRCGACCVNTPENRARAQHEYIEIAKRDSILGKKDLVRKLVVYDSHGLPHLRLDADGRCLALRGALGKSVECAIYHHRPTPCRRVEQGDEECLRRRAEIGL